MCELNSRMNRTRFPKQTNLRQISAYPVAGDGGFLRKFDRPEMDQGHSRMWSFQIRPRRNRRPGAAITSATAVVLQPRVHGICWVIKMPSRGAFGSNSNEGHFGFGCGGSQLQHLSDQSSPATKSVSLHCWL